MQKHPVVESTKTYAQLLQKQLVKQVDKNQSKKISTLGQNKVHIDSNVLGNQKTHKKNGKNISRSNAPQLSRKNNTRHKTKSRDSNKLEKKTSMHRNIQKC